MFFDNYKNVIYSNLYALKTIRKNKGKSVVNRGCFVCCK